MAEKVIAIKVDLKGTEAQQKKLARLETEVKKLSLRRTELNKALKKGTISLKQYGKEIAEVNTKLKANRREMLVAREQILGMDSFTTKLGKSFKKLGTSISGAFIGLFALQKVFEIGQAAAQLIIELDELTVGVQRLGNVSEETAKKTSASILAISSTFEASTSEILTAANAVSSQFGITLDEAVEKIKTGFAAGSNASGEFLNVLKEYPALLKEVGLDADQTFALINQQVTEGVYSDKGVDAIKEAGLRLRELPKATKEALDGIGLRR
jgi:DNA gyrase/topoisomerase IV subunit A